MSVPFIFFLVVVMGKQRRYFMANQHAKKVVCDSLGLVDFAIGLVKYVFNLSDGQVKFLREFKYYRRTVIKPADQKKNFGLVEITIGRVHAHCGAIGSVSNLGCLDEPAILPIGWLGAWASYSLLEW